MVRNPPIFVDTTLRDGEQAPGVAFTLEEKLHLVELLVQSGITEFEIGTPSMGRATQHELRTITAAHPSARMLAWCRAMPSDIELASKCGVNGIHLSFPLSDKLINLMSKSRQWVLSQVSEIVSQSYNHFDYVSIGAQDASRADINFLQEFASKVVDAGAKRLRLADTVGTLNPFTTHSLVTSVREVAPNISLEYHAHNDLGMACANGVSAWMAGADALSTTVNGLGERAGNSPYEEVVMAIEKSCNISTGLNKKMFPELCSYVEKISGRINSPSKPVVGELALSHESGLHTRYLQRDRSSYQIISADDIGLKEINFKIGKHTCMTTLRHILQLMGVECDDAIMPTILDRVREWCVVNKRDLMAPELVELYTKTATLNS